jgi:hypothetical protein
MDLNAVEVRIADGIFKKSTLKCPQLQHLVVTFFMPKFNIKKYLEKNKKNGV